MCRSSQNTYRGASHSHLIISLQIYGTLIQIQINQSRQSFQMATVMFYTGRDRINYSHWDLFYQTVNFQQKLPISSRSFITNTLISRLLLLLDMIPLPLVTIMNPRLGHTRRTITIPPRHHHHCRLECGGLQILLYIINSHTHIREISKQSPLNTIVPNKCG